MTPQIITWLAKHDQPAVDDAAKRMGVSRSEFFARAAERWLDALQDDDTTTAINQAIRGLEPDHGFAEAAAAALVTGDPR